MEMKRKRRSGIASARTFLVLICGVLPCFWGCLSPPSAGRRAAPDHFPPVAVGLPPAAWLVERIGGEAFQVFTVLEGGNPHTFEPSPSTAARVASCGLALSMGMPFEEKVFSKAKELNPSLKVVRLVGGDAPPHAWLDLQKALPEAMERTSSALQEYAAEWIRRGVPWTAGLDVRYGQGGPPPTEARIRAMRTFIRGKYDELRRRTGRLLDGELSHILEPYRGRTIIVQHPCLAPLLHPFDIHEFALEKEGHAPGPRRIALAIEKAKSEGLKAVIGQPQFPCEAARTVARQLHVPLLMVDPLKPDILRNAVETAEVVRTAFEGPRTREER